LGTDELVALTLDGSAYFFFAQTRSAIVKPQLSGHWTFEPTTENKMRESGLGKLHKRMMGRFGETVRELAALLLA
jgi:hypothetical protein